MGLFRRPKEAEDPQAVINRLSTQPAVPAVPVVPVVPSRPAVPSAGDVPGELSRTGLHMRVGDVFGIAGRGTVVAGQVVTGTVGAGDRVGIYRVGALLGVAEVAGVEKFRKVVERAGAGDNVGVRLAGVGEDDVRRGDVLASAE